jgi:DNA-binding winged helix-turn-helix (wHTH) protein
MTNIESMAQPSSREESRGFQSGLRTVLTLVEKSDPHNVLGGDRSGADAFIFGIFQLVPSQRLLLKADEPLHIGSRALDILIALAERPGEVVTKDELMRRVWPNTFIGDGNLKVQVATLRKVLGGGQNGERYIINVHGRGYVLVACVRRGGYEPSGPSRQQNVLTNSPDRDSSEKRRRNDIGLFVPSP